MKISCLLIGVSLFFGLQGLFADDAADLETSLAKWQKAKAECKDNYSYKVSFSSFSGFGNETTIVVKGGKVVERKYREFGGPPALVPSSPDSQSPKKDDKGWVEKGEDIGGNKKGAPAKTLDELYVEAKAVVDRETKEFEKRYLRFDKAGLLSSCFTVDTRIADDAPTKGVRISGLTLMNTKKAHRSPSGKVYPEHWGAPPLRQTRDLRQLPGGYGRGSGTLAKWIQQNLDKDAKGK